MQDRENERRRSERVEAHIPVKYHTLRGDASHRAEASLTRDLSEGGIRFRTGEFVSMACRLILELDIPVFNKPIKAISKVAWIRKTESSDEYEIGNQFLEMSKRDRKLVSQYVNNIDFYKEPVKETS